MRIFILRHAPAVASEDWEDKEGAQYADDRPLTKKGRHRMELAAPAVAFFVGKIDLMLCSPLKRARQTLEVVAPKIVDCPTPTLTDALLPDSSPRAIVKHLWNLNPPERVMIIGHEPHLGLLISDLLGVEKSVIAVKKAGLIELEVFRRPRYGEIRAAITPGQLRVLGALGV